MAGLNRREFVQGLAATLAAPALLRASHREPRFPIGFSTLGCPRWDWKTILENASAWGYRAIELRGIQGEMDLVKRPEFQGSRLQETRESLRALDLVVSDLGSSARFHDSSPAERSRNLDEGRRFVDLAHALGVPYVRVFGNDLPGGEVPDAVMSRIAEGLRALGEHAKGSGVLVLLESHGDLVTSPVLGKVLAAAGPGVALLWDTHHTLVTGHEPAAVTFAALGGFVRHTHLKDSRREGDGRRYVLTGKGDLPLRDTVRVLAAGGYTGFYGFEWEKVWHPEIEEPEVAFPHYARTMGGYLVEAGVRAA